MHWITDKCGEWCRGWTYICIRRLRSAWNITGRQSTKTRDAGWGAARPIKLTLTWLDEWLYACFAVYVKKPCSSTLAKGKLVFLFRFEIFENARIRSFKSCPAKYVHTDNVVIGTTIFRRNNCGFHGNGINLHLSFERGGTEIWGAQLFWPAKQALAKMSKLTASGMGVKVHWRGIALANTEHLLPFRRSTKASYLTIPLRSVSVKVTMAVGIVVSAVIDSAGEGETC